VKSSKKGSPTIVYLCFGGHFLSQNGFYPGEFVLTECTSFRWTHFHAGLARRSVIDISSARETGKTLWRAIESDPLRPRLVLRPRVGQTNSAANSPIAYLIVPANERLNGNIPAVYGDVDNCVNAPVTALML
jgi:hypothetical protein